MDGSIFKDHTFLSSNKTAIPFSPIHLCHLTNTEEPIMVDTMKFNPMADITRTTKAVRDLARILWIVDPLTFGLPTCRGVVRSCFANSTDTFEFLFAIPPSLKNPESLRAILIKKISSRSSRLDFAKQLTSSVLFMYNLGRVHKNIRPETIIVFENETTNKRKSILVGFSEFRPATPVITKGIWQHDLYRHPTRQGSHPEDDYTMQHDIYSLGVVLLEIGLSETFINYPAESSDADAIPSEFITQFMNIEDTGKRAEAIKSRLISLAQSPLPAEMSREYADVVMLCLQYLDSPPFSGDEDGITLGVSYMEKILLRMHDLQILD